MLIDGQALEGLDRNFWGVLGLQVTLEDVDIVINALQALATDDVDAFGDLG
jgi:hypothetical protein